MFFSDKITLKTVTNSTDANGYPTTSISTSKEVWVNKKSVTRSEFYAANANGINATIAFEVNAEDYDGQRLISYESKDYEVIRAYQKGEGKFELTCSDKAV